MKKNTIINQPYCYQKSLLHAAVILLMVCFLFSGGPMMAAKKESPPTFKLIKIEKGCTKYKGDRGTLNVEADKRGGRCRAKLRYNKKCEEEYEFSWRFHSDITLLKPGEKFKVTVKVKLLSPICCKANPYITATGSYGSGAYLESLKELLKKEKSGGNFRGTTYRVYAKKISKVNRNVGLKTTELRVWERSKGNGIAWFKIKLASLSRNSCNYEIAYVYKANTGG